MTDLTRRDAKRAALVLAIEQVQQLAARRGQHHAIAVALDEVADELHRRVARYDAPRTGRQHRIPGDVDDLLIRLAATAGAGTTVTIRSWPAAARHGQHAVTVDADDLRVAAEGHTARTAVRRALEATERRIRADKKWGRGAAA